MSALPTQQTEAPSPLKFVPTPEQVAEAEARFAEHSRRWEAAGGDVAASAAEQSSTQPRRLDAVPPPAAPSPPSAWRYAAETISEAMMIPGLVAIAFVYGAVCWALIRWALGVIRGNDLW